MFFFFILFISSHINSHTSLSLSLSVYPRPQLLEYVGKGKSITDVGLAQARQPLTTRCHYYELEIVDAGEKCYIALGLARRVSFLRKELIWLFLLFFHTVIYKAIYLQ